MRQKSSDIKTLQNSTYHLPEKEMYHPQVIKDNRNNLKAPASPL